MRGAQVDIESRETTAGTHLMSILRYRHRYTEVTTPPQEGHSQEPSATSTMAPRTDGHRPRALQHRGLAQTDRLRCPLPQRAALPHGNAGISTEPRLAAEKRHQDEQSEPPGYGTDDSEAHSRTIGV